MPHETVTITVPSHITVSGYDAKWSALCARYLGGSTTPEENELIQGNLRYLVGKAYLALEMGGLIAEYLLAKTPR